MILEYLLFKQIPESCMKLHRHIRVELISQSAQISKLPLIQTLMLQEATPPL